MKAMKKRKQHKKLANFLCPNYSFSLSKLEFGALQTGVWNCPNWFIIGLTNFCQAYDNFLSHRWQFFITPLIIFCQAYEKSWQNFFMGFLLMKIVRAIVTVLCQYKGWFAWQNSNSVDSALATLRHCHPKNKLFSPAESPTHTFGTQKSPISSEFCTLPGQK